MTRHMVCNEKCASGIGDSGEATHNESQVSAPGLDGVLHSCDSILLLKPPNTNIRDFYTLTIKVLSIKIGL